MFNLKNSYIMCDNVGCPFLSGHNVDSYECVKSGPCEDYNEWRLNHCTSDCPCDSCQWLQNVGAYQNYCTIDHCIEYDSDY